MTHVITEAIIAEAQDASRQAYSTGRKIKGFMKNKYYSAKADIGQHGRAGAATALSKQVGKKLALAGKQIPGINLIVTASEQGIKFAAQKLEEKIKARRAAILKGKKDSGTLEVPEMIEMLRSIGKDDMPKVMKKLVDAVPKVERARVSANNNIAQANECESIYKSAQSFAYFEYRISRLRMYCALIRQYIDELDETMDRYDAQVVATRIDLEEAMDVFFGSVDASYHTANCKNKSHCYYHQHGIA